MDKIELKNGKFWVDYINGAKCNFPSIFEALKFIVLDNKRF